MAMANSAPTPVIIAATGANSHYSPPSTSPNTSPNSSPRTSPHTSPLSSPTPVLNSKRRNSTTTTQPISIIGSSSRFQKMKLEASTPHASPLIGSSPKKSWFSAFFSKAEKETKQKVIKETNGIVSDKSLLEITEEVTRVLKQLNISWDIIDSQNLVASSKSPSVAVKFLVEITNLDSGSSSSHFVSFVHQESGNGSDYDELCAKIQEELHL
jgi:hypothetical protein